MKKDGFFNRDLIGMKNKGGLEGYPPLQNLPEALEVPKLLIRDLGQTPFI